VDSLLDSLNGEASNGLLDDNAFNQVEHYCNYCDLSFPSGRDICEHMLERHVSSKPKQYHCSFCNEAFPHLSEIEAHLKKHSNGKHALEDLVQLKLICDFCPYVDSCISSFQIHCLTCTNNPANDNYQPSGEGRVCPHCSQLFQNNAYLQKHVEKKHTGTNQAEVVKKFVCDECGRRFISGASLGGHKKVHTKQANGKAPKSKKVQPAKSKKAKPKPVKKSNGFEPVKFKETAMSKLKMAAASKPVKSHYQVFEDNDIEEPAEETCALIQKPNVYYHVEEENAAVEDMPDFF